MPRTFSGSGKSDDLSSSALRLAPPRGSGRGNQAASFSRGLVGEIWRQPFLDGRHIESFSRGVIPNLVAFDLADREIS
jgi:hypothetical protein